MATSSTSEKYATFVVDIDNIDLLKTIFLLTNWDSGYDESISIEKCRRLGANISAEIVQQEFFFLSESGHRWLDDFFISHYSSLLNLQIYKIYCTAMGTSTRQDETTTFTHKKKTRVRVVV